MSEIGFYPIIDFTGGGLGALDKLDGSILNDKDAGVVITPSSFAPYSLDADSGAGESSPQIIAPNTNPGNKRWILTGGIFANIECYGQVTVASTIKHQGDADTYLYFTPDQLRMIIGGITLFNATGGKICVGSETPTHELSVYGIIASHVGSIDEENEKFRLARATSPTIRFHSIYSKCSSTITSNIIKFKLHDGVTTTSQATVLTLIGDGGVIMGGLKSGATQGAAGAAAGELWVTSGHATQEDNTVMMGV